MHVHQRRTDQRLRKHGMEETAVGKNQRDTEETGNLDDRAGEDPTGATVH